jgi:hypothetical protein
MSFLFIIERQFRAEKSLLSNRINNELLFINLATVPGRKEFYFPTCCKPQNVACKAMLQLLISGGGIKRKDSLKSEP